MGVKKKAAEYGDRVQWGKQMGTIIHMHPKGSAWAVLPDEGPKTLRMWPKAECVVLDDRPVFCPRCKEPGHRAESCQAEYLAWRARKQAELARQALDFNHNALSVADPWDFTF